MRHGTARRLRVSSGSWDVILLLASMGLNSLPFGYMLVVLPIYLSDVGFSGEVIGAVTAISSISNTIALIPFAIAADRYGRKPFIMFGFLASTAAYLIFAFTHDLNLILLASALGGVGLAGGFSAAVWTPAWTALLTEAARERRTSAFAWSQGVWALALTVGSTMSIIPFLLRTGMNVGFNASYEYMFIVLGGFAAISGVVLLPVKEVQPKQPRKAKERRWLRVRSRGQIAKFSITVGLVGFASGLGVQLLSLWFFKAYGVSETLLGPWFAAAEATSLIVVPFVSRLTSRIGSAKSVLLTQGVSAVLLAVAVLAPTYEIAGALYIVRNLFMNVAWPIQQSYLMGTVRAEERASASAITYTVWGVGSSMSPILAGYFLNGTGFLSISAPLILGGATYLASAVAFYVFFKDISPPDEATRKLGRYVARPMLD